MKDFNRQLIQDLLRTGDIGVACGKCGYNLRGLTGDIKTCPECGYENSVNWQVATSSEISKAKSRIDSQVNTLSLAIIFGVMVAVIGVLVIVLSWEPEISCFFFFAGLIAFSVLGANIDPLRRALREDVFYAVLLHFNSYRIAATLVCSLASGVLLVVLYFLLVLLQARSESTVIGILVFSFLVLIYSLYRVIRKALSLSRDEFQKCLEEGATCAVLNEKWEKIANRIDWSSVPPNLRQER